MTTLAQALEQSDTRTEATEALRRLIDAIILTPTQDELRIELKGNLAAMLSAATNAKRSPETGDLSLQVEIGCGGGI
jgi:site-specific DNA recombinase